MAGVLALGACQQEETGAPASGYSTEAIAFTSPYMSRSAQMRDQFESNDEVGVVGYCRVVGQEDYSTSPWDTKKALATPDMFYNEKLTYTEEGLWTYSSHRDQETNTVEDGLCPWYANEAYTYTFFAYYPYAEELTSHVNVTVGEKTYDCLSGNISGGKGTIALSSDKTLGDPIIRYTMPHTGTANTSPLNWKSVPDFMLSYKVDHLKRDGAVSLNFRHLLCAFEFEVNNFNPAAVTINNLQFRGEDFYKSVIVVGQESGYSVGSDRYSGYFNIISGGASSIEIPAAIVTGEDVTPSTVKLTADEAGELIDLLFITDAQGKITSGDCGIMINATMEGQTIGTGNRYMGIDSEMSFQAGVKSIFSINIVGNDFILQIRSDDYWEDGSDSDIRFE